MLYPVYVHPGDAEHAYGVTFPDFPGCFAAADDLDGLPAAIQEAVQAHFYGEPREAIAGPSSLSELAHHADYSAGAWMLVDVDFSKIDTTPVRINVSLPCYLVQQIDAYAAQHNYTRSGFLARAAQAEMSRQR